jgi:hypothetical protein
MKKRRGGLTPAELEKALGFEVYATVSEARDEMDNLLADGRFIDSKSQVHKETAKIVAKMLGKDSSETASASGFRLARLWLSGTVRRSEAVALRDPVLPVGNGLNG